MTIAAKIEDLKNAVIVEEKNSITLGELYAEFDCDGWNAFGWGSKQYELTDFGGDGDRSYAYAKASARNALLAARNTLIANMSARS